MLILLKYRYKNVKYYAPLCCIFLMCGIAKAQKPLGFTNTQQAVVYNTYKDKTSIKQSIRSLGKDAIFKSNDKHIGYVVRLENKLKQEQLGSIVTQISNNNGVPLYKDVQSFKIKKRGVYQKDFLFDGSQLQPGFYVSNINVVTDKFADTISYSFGYEPEKVNIKNNPPSDLVAFWQQAKNELNATPANYKITPRPDVVNKTSDTYEVEYSSVDKATIFGWLTVPKRNKKSPLLYLISDYMGELKPEYRSNMAVLSINTRGTGSSTTNYNYAYNDLGLVNIKDKNKYILKGIFLDAIRGLDLIKTFNAKTGIDNTQIVVGGSGLGASASVILAALYPGLKGIFLDSPSFMDMRTMINFNEGVVNTTFPSSMFKSYYTSKKNSKEAILATLDYFDPVYFAPYVSCPVLVGFGLKNLNNPASGVYNFFNQLRIQKKDKYVCKECETSLDRGFYGFKEAWLKEKLGQP